MSDMKIFNNAEFGEIRMVEIDGKPYAVGRDVAKALGYAKPENAIAAHCKGTLKRGIPTDGGVQQMNVIPEGDLYRLVANSQLPAAEKFERWIFDEVLPTIRKTGGYTVTSHLRLSDVNSAARIIDKTLKEAGVSAAFRATALKSLYAPVGVDIPLDGIKMPAKYYEPTEIAMQLGMVSEKGNPHAQAVTAIIACFGIGNGEKIQVPFKNSNGHSGVAPQYSESVVARIKYWLTKNNYPSTIQHNGKSFKVRYIKETA